MSLRFRLNMAIALSMFLIVFAGAVFTIYKARQSVLQEVQSSVNLALQTLDRGLAESLQSPAPLRYWQQRLAMHGQTRHLKVQIRTSGGKTLDFPEQLPAEGEAAPGWFVWLVHADPVRVVRRVETPEGWLSITLEDEPRDEIIEAWGEARGFLLLVLLQALLVFVLVQLVIGRALRSVPVILKGFEGLRAGDYSRRLPEFPLPEFASISRAFNHSASALERASAQNQALASRSLTLQEEERRTLSRELHDELGQSLTGVKVLCSATRKQLAGDSGEVDSIIDICDHLFGVVHSMMRRLRPTMLEDLGLAASLEDMLASWQQQNRNISVNLDYDPRVDACSTRQQINIFRIVQESLSNVSRHANASKLDIHLHLVTAEQQPLGEQAPVDHTTAIRLLISDNGRGFDREATSSGFGLMGIRERVQSMQGEFRIDAPPGHGVTLEAVMPFEKEKE